MRSQTHTCGHCEGVKSADRTSLLANRNPDLILATNSAYGEITDLILAALTFKFTGSDRQSDPIIIDSELILLQNKLPKKNKNHTNK